MTANVIALESGWENWSQVSISNINVTHNTLTVGLYTYDSVGGTWVSADDFELTPQ